jgi:O-antigen ligase
VLIQIKKNIEKHFNYILFGIFSVTFFLILLKPIEILKDSPGYLEMSLIRSPAYPIFIYGIQKIFGDYFLTAAVCVQFLILAIAVFFLVNTLRKVYYINPFWYLLLAILLLSPALYEVNVCSSILSEALAYPLYLVVFSLFIKGFSESKIKPLLVALPFLLLLLLTRGQFIYLAVVGFLLALYILWKQQVIKRIWILVIFIILPLIANFIDKTYHYVVHDHFVTTPWTGIHFITPALFVANESDVSVFSSEEEKSFFTEIYGKLEANGLTLSSLEENNSEGTIFYINNFSKIANGTVFNEGRYFFESPIEDAETFIKLDILTKQMSLPLTLKNFAKWSKLYYQNFAFGLNGSRYVMLYILLLVVALFSVFKTPSSEIKFILLGTLLTLFNIGIVSIGMHTIKRFTFYNDWILFFILFILIDFLIKKQKQYATRS